MIEYKIIYNDNIIVNVSGHALYSDYGNDIVCASVSSMLTMTVNLVDNLGYKFNSVKMEKGYTSFDVINNEVTKGIVTTLEELLDSLSKKYPKNVKRIN
ncbi:MAG: ribosomal-processing cysteine protease Prp [Acholeplasmatales bacterium]|nr:ribosomal-processing cysteine protease Prp [Acholeplasmatales bacterium]